MPCLVNGSVRWTSIAMALVLASCLRLLVCNVWTAIWTLINLKTYALTQARNQRGVNRAIVPLRNFHKRMYFLGAATSYIILLPPEIISWLRPCPNQPKHPALTNPNTDPKSWSKPIVSLRITHVRGAVGMRTWPPEKTCSLVFYINLKCSKTNGWNSRTHVVSCSLNDQGLTWLFAIGCETIRPKHATLSAELPINADNVVFTCTFKKRTKQKLGLLLVVQKGWRLNSYCGCIKLYPWMWS